MAKDPTFEECVPLSITYEFHESLSMKQYLSNMLEKTFNGWKVQSIDTFEIILSIEHYSIKYSYTMEPSIVKFNHCHCKLTLEGIDI